jgi:hypothetical protein
MAEDGMSKYDRLVKSLAAKDRRKGRKGKPRDVKALAAWIGREKYGAAEFQRRAAAGRRRAQ